MAGPSIKVLTAPNIGDPTRWTVPLVRAAIDQHEVGQFCESARLARAFGRDDRISTCTGGRIGALVSAEAAEFSLQPSTTHRASSKAIISALSWYDDVVTTAWLRKTLHDIIHLGFSISYVVWSRSKSSWNIERLIHWDAEFVYYDEYTQRYVALTVDAGVVYIDPDDPNWLVFTPGGEKSWLSGGVRSLGIPFLLRGFDFRDWARFNERHGLPIITVREPSGADRVGEKQAFYSGVKQMGSTGILRLPQGMSAEDSYGVDLLEAKSRSFDSFDKFLDRLNIAIAIFVCGQNLTTEVSAGAYASTGWHFRVRRDFALADSVAVSGPIRTLIQRWARFNVRGFEDEAAPWPTWDLELPEDQNAVAETTLKGAQAIQLLLESGVPVDWDVLLPRLGLPLAKGKKMPEAATQPAEPEEQQPPPAEPPPAEQQQDSET